MEAHKASYLSRVELLKRQSYKIKHREVQKQNSMLLNKDIFNDRGMSLQQVESKIRVSKLNNNSHSRQNAQFHNTENNAIQSQSNSDQNNLKELGDLMKSRLKQIRMKKQAEIESENMKIFARLYHSKP